MPRATNNSGVKTNKDPINKTPKVNRNDVQCSRPKREAVSKARYMEIYWKKCRTMQILHRRQQSTVQNIDEKTKTTKESLLRKENIHSFRCRNQLYNK